MAARILILTFLCICSSKSLGCSFAQMLEGFNVVEGSGAPPLQPDFIVHEIHRGTDDGSYSSCSDAGILTLKLSSPQPENTGYIFEIVEGDFEDHLFQGGPVQATAYYAKDGFYKFVWLDGSSVEQEPINIIVKIQAISKTGKKSESQHLKIQHIGVKKPWWNLW